MCDPISLMVGLSAVGTVKGAVDASKARKEQRRAGEQMQAEARAARRTEDLETRATRRDSAKGRRDASAARDSYSPTPFGARSFFAPV